MSRASHITIMISGGGTGGHVFPAIAIANALQVQAPGISIRFVGATGKLEMEKVPEAGYPIDGLWISGLQRKLSVRNLSFPFKLLSSLWKSNRLLARYKPAVVVGVGGYASGPLGYMAARRGIPVVLQEQNSFPGITNRLLASKAALICVAYEGMERFFPADKVLLLGNPVRQGITGEGVLPVDGRAFFGLDPQRPTLLVVGGSLGARTINESIAHQISKLMDSGVQVIWQTGKLYFDQYKSLQETYQGRLVIMPFIREMDKAYAGADIVVSRAGAIAVSELCLVGKPVILVPSPNVAEDHQRKNAEALVGQDAAVMVLDRDAKEELVPVVLQLFSDPARQAALSAAISKLGLPHAAAAIAEQILTIVHRKAGNN